MTDASANSNSACRKTWAQFAGILLAAIVLGVIYNNASPLRVHEIAADDSAAAPVAVIPRKSAKAPTGVHNETISMTLEIPSVAAAPTVPVKSAAPVAASPQLVIPSLKWPQVKALLDAGKVVVVDARLKANYDLGHIPTAVSLPANSPAEELQAFAAKYPKTTAFVTYCGSDSCHMSHQLAESLIKIYGFTNVSNMPGGFAEYTIANPAAK